MTNAQYILTILLRKQMKVYSKTVFILRFKRYPMYTNLHINTV